jgi:hypothetical protein
MSEYGIANAQLHLRHSASQARVGGIRRARGRVLGWRALNTRAAHGGTSTTRCNIALRLGLRQMDTLNRRGQTVLIGLFGVALQVILTALSVFSSVEAFLLNERWPSTMTRFLSILVDAEAGCDEVF